MQAQRRSAYRRPLLRSLAILSLLMGLFAMHGLSSSHASMADLASPATHQMLESDLSAPVMAAPSSDGVASAHSPAMLGMGSACLAVLSAVALAVLLLLRRRQPATTSAPNRGGQVWREGSPVPRPPPVLFRLCVCRT